MKCKCPANPTRSRQWTTAPVTYVRIDIQKRSGNAAVAKVSIYIHRTIGNAPVTFRKQVGMPRNESRHNV
jgi:hypothetical protein